MSSATATLFNGCLSSHTKTLFVPRASLLPLRSIPPIKLSFSSYPSWFPLRNQYPSLSSSSIAPLVAQTSNWAQSDQDTLVDEVEEEEEEELNWEEGKSGTEASLADWDGEGEESGGEAALVEEDEDSYPEPPEEAKLFVGNLPYDVDSEKLARLFDKAGVVEVAEVIYNRQTDQSRGFGFVTMSTVEEAEKAVEMFHRYDLNGRLLTVNQAAPRGYRPELPPRVVQPSFRAYVGNLPWEVDNARLKQIFCEHGEVVDARVVYEMETGRSRGFGFVTMSNQGALYNAISALDGQSLDGRVVKVNVAEERPRRRF